MYPWDDDYKVYRGFENSMDRGEVSLQRKDKMTVYTIGYSPFSLDEFIKTIQFHHISCLIDVRSNPHSAYYTDYDKDILSRKLKDHNIIYRNYAREFGARQEDPHFYTKDGYLSFELYTKSDQFQAGVEKLRKGISLGYNFVLMCAEKDPMNCHRAIMIGKALKDNGFKVVHILYPHGIETQEEMEQRAIGSQISFFSEEERIQEFYEIQNQKIGYRLGTDREGNA